MAPRAFAAYALLAFGFLRAALFVAHDPLLAYGNQFDMHRTGACAGIFPAIPAPARYAPSQAAPIPGYIRQAPTEGCYASAAVAVVGATDAIARALGAGDDFRIRWMGIANLALMSAIALCLSRAFRADSMAALANAAVFAWVLCDPFVTLWFSTLYTEPSVLAGLYATVGGLCALALQSRPGSAGAWALTLGGAALLATSKEQFALLPAILIAASLPWLPGGTRTRAAPLLVGAICMGLLCLLLLPRHGDIRKVNRIHAYLGVLVPASSDPAAALAALDLPAECLSVSGSPWFERRGRAVDDACSKVFALPDFAFLRLMPSDPAALLRSVARVMHATQQAELGYLGHVAGEDFGSASEWWIGTSALDPALRAFTASTYAGIVLLWPLAALLLAGAAIGGFPRRSPAADAGAMLTMLAGTTIVYTLLATVFGDGLAEAGRHFLAAHVFIAAGLVIAAVCAPRWMRHRAFAVAAMATAGLAILLAVAESVWAAREPLAIGQIDAPEDCRLPKDLLSIRGWALAPTPVESVEIRLDSRVYRARYGEETPKLERIFPGYPDAHRGGFSFELKASEVPAGSGKPVDLGIRVNSRGGGVTVIDHCPLAE